MFLYYLLSVRVFLTHSFLYVSAYICCFIHFTPDNLRSNIEFCKKKFSLTKIYSYKPKKEILLITIYLFFIDHHGREEKEKKNDLIFFRVKCLSKMIQKFNSHICFYICAKKSGSINLTSIKVISVFECLMRNRYIFSFISFTRAINKEEIFFSCIRRERRISFEIIF